MHKLTKKILSAVLSACMITTLFAGTAMAANDREKILNIGLAFDTTIEAGQGGGTVTATPLAGGYSVTSATLINAPETWTLDSVPQAEIVVTADSAHYFPLANRSIFDLKNGTRFNSAVLNEDKSAVTLKVTLAPVGDGRDLSVASANWSADGSFVANWAAAGDAEKYQVRLFRGSITIDQVGSVVNVEGATTYDFSTMIKEKGDYHFEVRAVNHHGTKGEWTSSEMLYVTKEFEEAQKAASESTPEKKLQGPGVDGMSKWIQDDNGWWFRNRDGSYTTNNWQQIGDKWYFFDGSGYMKTGWIDWNGRWFYCDGTGAMLVNTTTPDGYSVGADGAML